MKQYLLSVHGTHGDPTPPPDEMQKMFDDVDKVNQEIMAKGAWVFAGGLHRPVRRDRGPGREGPADADRRPVRRDQGAARRLLGHQGGRPGRRPGLGRAGPRWPAWRPVEVRPFQDELRPRDCARPRTAATSTGSSGRSPAGSWPPWSASSATSTSPRRRSRRRSPSRCERWPAAGLPPNPGGWIVTTARNRAIDRLRREATRDDRHAQAALLHEPDEPHGRWDPCATTGCG